MRIKFSLTFIVLSFILNLSAQEQIFIGSPLKTKQHPALKAQFKKSTIYQLDINGINDFAKSGAIDIDFNLALGNKFNWNFSITPHDIRTSNYVLRAQTDNGIETLPLSENKTFRGSLQGNPNSVVALTLDEDFMYGFVRIADEYFFIEPLWYFVPNAPKNQIVVYSAANVIEKEGHVCGAMELKENKAKIENAPPPSPTKSSTVACYEIELAIASDDAMFDSYGSVTAVENHNIAVNNNVNTDYDNAFTHELVFKIVEQFVVTNNNNGWGFNTGSPNAGTLLDAFRSWGNGGGFTNTYDLASLWTDLDLQGSTIGVAYLGVLCEFSRYNVLQDFSTNANFLRVLTSHEYGHNLNSGHDASGAGTIMAPSVNNTTSWSTASVNTINSQVTQKINSGCLQTCAAPVAPTALFAPNYQVVCEGSMVTMLDQSFNNPNSWSWSFPGGTPSSSTDQFPTVTYPNSGTYNASLTVSNANGSNTFSQNIIVGLGGTDFFHYTDFESGMNGWSIENPNNNVTWASLSNNSSRYGNTVMWFDNFNNNVTDERDALVSPTLDFAGRTVINLEFDYAYARFNNSFKDSLVVSVSTDGGVSYERIFAETENGGGNFATVSDQGQSWTPDAASDWCYGTTFGPSCINLDLSAYAGSSNAKIKIENVNGWGNNMYVDNIKVTSDCQLSLPPVAFFTSDTQFGCTPLQVQFSDQSQNNPDFWFWEFPGGSPSTATVQNPIIFYTQSGTYDVTLTVTNLVGSNTFTFPAYINVDEAPVPNFTYTNTDLTFNFTSTSTGNITNYDWDFGDGNGSIIENPTHTYDTDGNYTVTLTTTNNCGTTSIFDIVTAASMPSAGFAANVTSGCAPLTVDFQDQSSANVSSWDWSFPGGTPSTSTDQNPSITYDVPGIYDVTLEVSNASGTDISFFSNYISVDDVPSAGFLTNITNNIGVFSNTSSNANSYSWDFGDNNFSTDPNPTHNYAEDGTYTVVLEATNDCGTSTFEETITIATAPAFASFNANTTSGCAPITVDFIDLSPSNVTSWDWTFSGGTPSSSTQQNPSITYNTAGTYDVTLTVSNAQGHASTSEFSYIVVDDVPQAAFLTNVNNSTATFSNNSTNAISYMWDFGDNNFSTDPNPTHTYAMDGTYTVSLTSTNDCGSTTITQTVLISNLPIAGFSANNTSGCAPMTVQFSDESSDNTTGWDWTFTGGNPATSNDPNPTVTYSQAGTYDVTLTVTNAAGNNTTSQTSYIIVNDVPEPNFTQVISDLTANFTNFSTNATSYQWDFGDNNMSTDPSPVHTYAADGTYTVILTATNDCDSNTFTAEINISTLPTAAFSANATVGCAPFEVQFFNNSSDNTTSLNWSFPGGNPANSTNENPIITYDTPGIYDVTLIATNATGDNSSIMTSYITVLDVPTAAFLTNVNGADVNLTNNSVGATSQIWDFGDSNMSTSTNPNHTYSMDGTYTITLTTENQCGTTTTEQEVTILTPPTAGFTLPTTTACLPFTIQLMDNSSSNSTAWNWTLEGGNPATSNEQNPMVTYNEAGTYSVTLEVSNAAGSSTFTETNIIVINDVPTPDFSSSINGLDVDFINNSIGAMSQTWDFGDNNFSNNTNPSHSYAMDGVYTVILTTINDCGTTMTEQEVTIITPPSPSFTANVESGCAPLTVEFTDFSSENTTNWDWTFEGGNPASSNEQNPVVIFENQGSYSVTLIASNAAGQATLIQSNLITVGDVPEVDFNSTINGAVVNFNNNSTNFNTVQWDFGDDNMSAMPNPTHTYAEDGTYTVTLTATNDCGTVEITQEITIATPPTAGFSSAVTSGCAPFEVEFFNESSNNSVDFVWAFEGGIPATSTIPNPVVTYEMAGEFDVTLTVSNSTGDNTTTQSSLIIVNDTPEVNFGFTTDGLTADFTNNTNNATSYSWDFGDMSFSNAQNPSHEYAEDGAYLVTLTATNDCGQSVTTELVVIATAAPIAAFSSDVQTGCAPFEVQFENLSSANSMSLLWIFEGGDPATSTDSNPLVTYNTPGNYKVTLEATNPLGNDISEIESYIEVLPDAVADFDISQNISIIDFINTSQNANSYSWDFGDNLGTSDLENPSYEYTETGTYLVTLTVENECGTQTISQEVEIEFVSPNAGFTIENMTGCVPFTVEFNDTSSGNIVEWLWTFEGGNPASSTEQNPTVTFNNAGQFDVSLQVTNPAGMSEIIESSFITVEDVPTANFDFDPNVLAVIFTNTSTGGNTYLWDFGDDSATNDEENPTHIYSEPGMYDVVLVVTNDCGSVTITQTVTVMPDSTEEIPGIDEFTLFPNPNDGAFTLVLRGNPIQNLEYRFYNVIGQLLATDVLDFGNGNLVHQFNFPDFAKGVYVLELKSGNQSIHKKVVIE